MLMVVFVQHIISDERGIGKNGSSRAGRPLLVAYSSGAKQCQGDGEPPTPAQWTTLLCGEITKSVVVMIIAKLPATSSRLGPWSAR